VSASTDFDVVDHLIGVGPNDRISAIRDNRPEAREHLQGSFRAFFEPRDDSQFTLRERLAVAAFVACLHGVDAATRFYTDRLLDSGEGSATLLDVVLAESRRSATEGPYGQFRLELGGESTTGSEYVIDSVGSVDVLGERLVAALEHTHLLVFHPRDASRARLQALLDARWSTTGIVSLSQLVAFLTFQIRVVQGLQALNASRAGDLS
jgi:CMD domain protein